MVIGDQYLHAQAIGFCYTIDTGNAVINGDQ
jgi:hypothetical protein